MTLEIEVKLSEVEIRLKDQTGKIIAKDGWTDQNSLSRNLLVRIDRLLKKNQFKLDDLREAHYLAASPSYTAGRIADIVAQGISSHLTNFPKALQ